MCTFDIVDSQYWVGEILKVSFYAYVHIYFIKIDHSGTRKPKFNYRALHNQIWLS